VPSIPAARREQNAPPPAQRAPWFCPRCRPRTVPMGYAQNGHAAYLAGVRHYDETHRETAPHPHAQAGVESV